ncbi:glycosyltransferase [Bacteroides caecigallinarum]|uniref:glycosyltransferase n=1 Tax=Bacteroides caecigallinarum TaxID=1411144 RepID=UPI001F424375|nr:glycosyltransferase [Bacteroides caecigallinarum]MCF2594691.1 glycosyltransferase [Bacteroides caecigallinarum]
MNNEQKIIVSLTSFPAAIPYVVQSIRSILNGSFIPDKIVLYLDTQKFPNGIIPTELEALKAENNILEVRFDPRDIRSYKKLIPALEDFPNDIIITVDDDINYHKDLLSDLIRVHKQLPDCIIAHRVRKIKVNKPYSKWRKYKWYNFIFKRYHFDHLAMQTGVGGVLYPPNSLDEDMLDPELFMKLAPTNDDIWFWAAAVSKGTYVVPIPNGRNIVKEVGKPDNLALKTINLKSGDDRNREALDKILNYYPLIRKKLENNK